MELSLEEYMAAAPASARRVAEELRGGRPSAEEAGVPTPAGGEAPERAAGETTAAAARAPVTWVRISFVETQRLFSGMLADWWCLGKGYDPYEAAGESFVVYCRSDVLGQYRGTVTSSSQAAGGPASGELV